jgi:hypothetical protein
MFFCDNEAVVKNSTRPESTLKKKHPGDRVSSHSRGSGCGDSADC